MRDTPRRKPVPEEVWAKLEKLWTEEGLRASVLAQRFAIGEKNIAKYLKEKHGTSVPPIWRGYAQAYPYRRRRRTPSECAEV